MESNRRHKAIAWGISVVIHLLLFAVVALTGLFAKLSSDPDKVLDVTLYELETAAAGGAEAAGAESGGNAEPAAGDAMAVTVEEAVLDQSAAVVRAVEEKAAAKAESMQAARQESGSGEKGKESSQTGSGMAGQEKGSKEGTGIGEGQETGAGSGDRDDAAAGRPAVPPQLVAGAAPAYPEGLRRQGIEGAVRVRVVVGRDGSVESAAVTSSSGYEEMDAAAVAAAYRYRFAAARNSYGDPVRCAVGQTVQFRLDGAG